MDQRALIVALAGGLLAAPRFAGAQPLARVYRIGFVSPSSSGYGIKAFRQGLREFGYIEGKNLLVEERVANVGSDRLPELVAELIGLKVDVLVVTSTPAVLAAKRATTTVPVVFAGLFDPVGSGVVASLARPGALAKIGVSGAQGIIVTNDPFLAGANSAKLVQFAASKRLRAVYFFPTFVDDGGLMAYGVSYADSQRTAARYVDLSPEGGEACRPSRRAARASSWSST